MSVGRLEDLSEFFVHTFYYGENTATDAIWLLLKYKGTVKVVNRKTVYVDLTMLYLIHGTMTKLVRDNLQITTVRG